MFQYPTYKIPTGVTKLGAGCFYSAKHLSTVDIPNTVQEIEYTAFEWSSISSIYMPKSIKKIGFSAFDNCKNLTVVNYEGNASDWILIEIGDWNSVLLQATRNYNQAQNN